MELTLTVVFILLGDGDSQLPQCLLLTACRRVSRWFIRRLIARPASAA